MTAPRSRPRTSNRLPPLQALDKILQASVIGCGVVPETRVSGGQHPDFCGAQAIHLPINNGGFNNRIVGAMGDQHGFTERWQHIVVVERSREQCLTHVRGNADVEPQHQVALFGRKWFRKTQTKQ